jgi:hypothetical protein
LTTSPTIAPLNNDRSSNDRLRDAIQKKATYADVNDGSYQDIFHINGEPFFSFVEFSKYTTIFADLQRLARDYWGSMEIPHHLRGFRHSAA